MALAFRPAAFRVDADMHLQIAGLKPRATTALQLGRFGDFRQAQDFPIEAEGFRFQRLGRGNLDMVDDGNAKAHLICVSVGPHLLASPASGLLAKPWIPST